MILAKSLKTAAYFQAAYLFMLAGAAGRLRYCLRPITLPHAIPAEHLHHPHISRIL